MKSLTSRAVVYGLVVLLGLASALPNLLPSPARSALPRWYVDNTFALGLDLRGGSHLLLDVQTADLYQQQHDNIADSLTAALRKAGVPYQPPEASGESLRIAPRRAADAEAFAAIAREVTASWGGVQTFRLHRDGNAFVIAATKEHRKQLLDDALERSLEVVRRRLNETGLAEPAISRHGREGILVQLPGVDDPAQVRALLGTTAKMTFHWVAEGSAQPVIQLSDDQGQRYRLEKRVALEGRHISDATLAYHPETGEPVVNFRLDKEGAQRFAELTRANIGRPFAVVLDDRVITAPVIRSAITGGSGEISGAFNATEANELALLLRAGALPVPLSVVEERTVGPDLGSDAIAMGLATGALGALLVAAFMIGIYGTWGVIACIGLAINVGLLFGVLSLFGATLTLPGIAGVILTLGMAVDANILINERIREEARKGRSARAAMHEGFARAYSTILDSNLTTLIAVSLLFLCGSGPVRGFAVTIGIGLITSLFTAIAVNRLLMEWRVRGRLRETLQFAHASLLERYSQRTFNVMRGRYLGLAVSALLSLGSLALFVKPGLHYGVDFSGGTVVEVTAPEVTVSELRKALAAQGMADAALQEFGEPGQFLLRLPPAAGQPVHSVDALKDTVRALAPEAEFPRVDMVGPKVSGGFAEATLLAILLAGGAMLAYLWVRFEYHFALAATLTIALDLTKTIGFFALTGLEFNLTAVAALLALIGYSINDKVVVFDRVREGLRATPDKPLLELLNESVSATLTRTVFTSVTTFLALVPMALAGGHAVASFVWPMLFGVVIGTSSSVFIACPIVYFIGARRTRKGLAQLRPTAEQLRAQLADTP